MNGVFADSCRDRIRFICDHYPCPLKILPGNAAIARGWQFTKKGTKAFRYFAEAVARDFDRIITTVNIEGYDREQMLSVWEEAMPGFRAVPIGDEKLVLVTKIPEDFVRMEEENYKYGNAMFAIRPH